MSQVEDISAKGFKVCVRLWACACAWVVGRLVCDGAEGCNTRCDTWKIIRERDICIKGVRKARSCIEVFFVSAKW